MEIAFVVYYKCYYHHFYKNMEFFRQCGMCLAVGNRVEELPAALEKLQELAPQMRANQKKYINAAAAEDICKFAESITETHGDGT